MVLKRSNPGAEFLQLMIALRTRYVCPNMRLCLVSGRGAGHVLGQRGQMLFSLPSTVQSSRFFWAGPKYNTGWTDCSEVWAGSPNGGVGQGSSVKRFMLLPIPEYILGYMHTSFGSETWILESTKKIVLNSHGKAFQWKWNKRFL